MKRLYAEHALTGGNRSIQLRWLGFLPVAFVLMVVGLNLWMTTSARPLIFHDLSAVPTNSVGLLLGADRILQDGSTNLHFISRTESAARLILSGKVTRLLVSGHPDNRGYNEPQGMAEELVRLGVPRDRLDLDELGHRTWESIRSARHRWNITRCTLITDEFHAARATFLCRRAGIQGVAFSPMPVIRNRWTVRSDIREWFARIRALVDFD